MAIKYRAFVDGGYVEFTDEAAARNVSANVEVIEYVDDDSEVVALSKHLDEIRWRREQGGITVGGLPVLTRDRDKTLITGKITQVLVLGLPDADTFTFTLAGQDVSMTIGQLKMVGVAIAEHVQRTVDAAALVRPEIMAGALTTPDAVTAAFDAAYESLT